MSAKTIKSALGLLQDDPDHGQGVASAARPRSRRDPGMSAEDLRRLLEAARRAHDARREYDAVAVCSASRPTRRGARPREAELVGRAGPHARRGPARRRRARAASTSGCSTLRPGDATRQEAIERAEAKRGKWRDLVDRYVQEARGSGDAVLPQLTAGERGRGHVPLRARRGSRAGKRVEPLLREALDLDLKNRRAELLLERLLRGEGRWDESRAALERFAAESTQKEEKVAALQRLARVLRTKSSTPERAASVVRDACSTSSPAMPEATSFLADYFTTSEQWEHLVALYEGQLASGALRGKDEEFGAILQIAMVHWRMRGRPDAAEPWFERLRKLEPAQPGHARTSSASGAPARGETTRLVDHPDRRAARDARRARALVASARRSPSSPRRGQRQKAIEQWRSLYRQDPTQRGGARRAQAALPADRRLERADRSPPAGARELPRPTSRRRLAVLREIAAVYREHIKSDSALVTVLSRRSSQLDPDDLASVRELARVYEALAALARSARRRRRGRPSSSPSRGEGRALARRRAALARAVLERPERDRGVREAPRGRSRRRARRSTG